MENKYEGTFYEYQKKKIDDFVEEITSEWIEAFQNLYGRKPKLDEFSDGLWQDVVESFGKIKTNRFYLEPIAPMVPPQDYQWDTKSFERESLVKLKRKQIADCIIKSADTFAEEAERQLGEI